MKNRILLVIATFVCVLGGLTFVACNSEVGEISKDAKLNADLLKLIEAKLNLVKVNSSNNISLLSEDLQAGAINSYFQTKNENEYFVISQIENKYILTKGSIDGSKFVESSSFTLLDNMDDSGNGNYKIINTSENVAISQTVENSKVTNVFTTIDDKQVTLGFCQRENGETYRQCNNREADEFCDDFISTVAYITNPTIAILIAAMCSC